MDFLELSSLLRTHFRISEMRNPPRYRRFHLPFERIVDVLQGNMSVNLPEDCTVYGVGMSEDHYGLYLILYSEEWDPISEGCEIPEHVAVFTTPKFRPLVVS